MHFNHNLGDGFGGGGGNFTPFPSVGFPLVTQKRENL